MTFHEVQNQKPWFTYFVLGLVMIAMWYGFVQQIVLGVPFGTNPAPDSMMWVMTLIFGAAFPIFMLSMRLIVEVDTNGVWVRYTPFVNRTIAFSDIERVEVRTYNAIAEYGGWGIRMGFGLRNKIAYNATGNQGVELTLKNGKRILLGSQQADALAKSIQSYL